MNWWEHLTEDYPKEDGKINPQDWPKNEKNNKGMYKKEIKKFHNLVKLEIQVLAN